MSTISKLEETKALELMKLRGYKLIAREEQKGFVRFTVKSRSEEKPIIIWCMQTRATVGIRIVNQLNKEMESVDAYKGIIISSGQYSYAAKNKSKKENIELIPKNFPHFNIFKHMLVPTHEILTLEERNEMLRTYRVRPHQLPWIKQSDPTVIAIGAVPGDIIKITRQATTAGEYVSYRYVIGD